jgi:hypothetical protein
MNRKSVEWIFKFVGFKFHFRFLDLEINCEF